MQTQKTPKHKTKTFITHWKPRPIIKEPNIKTLQLKLYMLYILNKTINYYYRKEQSGVNKVETDVLNI